MVTRDILIVDDHSVTRTGLKSLLLDLYDQINITEACDGDEILRVLKQKKIDIAILDLQLPNTDTISLIEWMSIRYPQTYTLAFSMLPENIYGHRVLKAGASGYLPKDSSIDEIKRAIELALSRKKYVSQYLVDMIANGAGEHISDNPFQKLSHREFEIVNLLLAGKSITAIGQELHIKPSTVGTYKSRIFSKLHVATLFELKEMSFLYGLNQQLPA